MDGRGAYKELSNVASSPPPYDYNFENDSPKPPPPTYSPIPRPPPPMSGYPASSYAPAPPVFQQQSTNNVVIVGQQPQPIQHHVVQFTQPRANTYIALTIVMMVLCFLHGNLPVFICLVPALICSVAASDHNSAGEYNSAKECGTYALACNVCTIVFYVLSIVAVILFVVLYFITLKDELEPPTICYNTCDYYGRCNYCHY